MNEQIKMYNILEVMNILEEISQSKRDRECWGWVFCYYFVFFFFLKSHGRILC